MSFKILFNSNFINEFTKYKSNKKKKELEEKKKNLFLILKRLREKKFKNKN